MLLSFTVYYGKYAASPYEFPCPKSKKRSEIGAVLVGCNLWTRLSPVKQN